MTLKEHIEDISNQLKQGVFKSEAAVSLGIVLRLLQALEWPIFKPQVVIPEYAVEGGEVDLALCCSHTETLIFVEVKQVRYLLYNYCKAKKQLFNYVSHKDVNIAILTDGLEWYFFSSDAKGEFKESCKLDLIENDSQECAKRLERYLNYREVETKKVNEVIEKDCRNNSNSLEKDPDWIFTAIAKRRWKHERPKKIKVAVELNLNIDELEKAIKNPKYDEAVATELRIYGEQVTSDWLKNRTKSPTSVISKRMWICGERAHEILRKVYPNLAD